MSTAAMSTAADFHSQIASIMEVLANAAVAEICKLVDDGFAVVQLDVSRSQKENELLRRKVKLLELQVARYRAERGRGAEAGAVRLLHRHPGPPLQNRTRFLNRGPAAQQSADQTQTVKLDQDPDQEVVTTTKTEPAEQEEAGLLIVKVEGAADVTPAPPEAQSTSGSTPSPAIPKVSGPDPAGRRRNETEARGGATGPARLDRDLDQEQGEERLTGPAATPLRFPAEPPPGGGAWRRDVVGPSWPDGDEEEPPQLRDAAGAAAAFDNGHGAPPVAMGTAASLYPDPQDHGDAEGPEGPEGRGRQQDGGPSRPPSLPYACTFCSRRYAHQCQLRIHRRVHTGEKPYRCAQCGKSFGQFCSLTRHQIVHTGERPFPCPRCGKHFSTSTNLKVHQSVHTGEKKFHCAKCGKNFSFLSNLIRHQALHAPK